MTARNPAAKGKRDSNHKAIADAIRLLGYPVMDLSAAGNGVEDLLVGIGAMTLCANDRGGLYEEDRRRWLLVECKVRDRWGHVQYTDAQRVWRARSVGWPRITVTSAQDAVEQIRGMTG